MFMCHFKIAIFKKGRRICLHESWLIRGLSDVQYCTIFCCTLPDWHCAQWGSRCGHGRVKTSSCCIVSEGEKYQIIFVLQGQLSIYVAVLTKSGPFSAKSIGPGLILQQEIEKQCTREKYVWIHFRKKEKKNWKHLYSETKFVVFLPRRLPLICITALLLLTPAAQKSMRGTLSTGCFSSQRSRRQRNRSSMWPSMNQGFEPGNLTKTICTEDRLG